MASNISLPPIIFPNTEIPSFEEILEDEDVNNLVFPNDDMVYLFKMEDLSEASVIGSSMHVVKRYLHIPSGNFMAVKQIHIPLSRHPDETKEKRLRKLNLEIHTHREIANSPYIVDFYGLCLYDGCALLCMELMDMSLHGLFTRCHYLGKIISEDLLGYTAVSILEALNVCKSKGIIHRDIKPENILIKKSGEIKLADFGESRFVDDSQKATTLGAGTIRYWPPERLYMERTKYDIRSDIWSFGLTLAEMAYGKYPIVHADGSDIDFQTVDLLMLQHQILEATADDIIDRCIRSKYSEDLCEFIWLCLQKLEDRANVEELVETDLYERFQARNTKWVAKLIQQALGEKNEQQENKKRTHRMPRKPDPKEIDLIWHQVDAESAQETNILCLGPPNIGKTSAIKYFIHNLTRIANLDQEVLNFPDTINSIPVTYTCSKGNIKYRFIDMPGIANDNVNSFIEDKISTKKPQETTPTNSYEAADLADTTLASPIMTSEEHLFSSLLHMLPTSMSIHRVCIFLKASVQVTTPYVLYCFMKILMNLHVASIEKISFCFINDEEICKNVSTGLSSLKLFCGDLSRLYGINLSCSDSNVFNILNSDLEMVEKSPENLNILSKEAIRFLTSTKSTSSFLIKHIQILNTTRNIVILMGQMLTKSLNKAIKSTKLALDQSKRFLDNHKRHTKFFPPNANNHATSSFPNSYEQQYERNCAYLEFYYTKEKNLKQMHKKFCDLLVNNAILPYISLPNLRDLNLQLTKYKKEQTYDPSGILHLEQLLDQTKLYNMEPPETNDCIIDEDELELAFKKLLDEPPISIFFSSMFLICNNHDKHVVLSTYYGYLKEFVEISKNCREVEFNLNREVEFNLRL